MLAVPRAELAGGAPLHGVRMDALSRPQGLCAICRRLFRLVYRGDTLVVPRHTAYWMPDTETFSQAPVLRCAGSWGPPLTEAEARLVRWRT